MSHQYATLEDTVYLFFGANDTGGSGADGATPVYDVRLAGAAADAAPVLSGSATLLSHVNYPAGAHEVAVAATAANGFASGNTYAVFCTLLVDSQNPTGFVGSFSLAPVLANLAQWLGTAPLALSSQQVQADATAISGSAAAADRAELFFTAAIAYGTVNTVSDDADFTLTSTDLTANDNDYNGMWLVFLDNNNKFVPRVIGTYTGATKRVQFTGSGLQAGFPRTVQAGDQWFITAGIA